VTSVQVVFCMDTEGPCVDPANPELLRSWPLVDTAMDKLFAADFRARYPDPSGGVLRIGWFFLTWTGFATNPRARDFGYHRVRDHYVERWGERIEHYGDEHCWHYHHPAASGVGNEWGLDWGASREHDEIVSRQLLERDWFSAAFRAGGTILTNEASRWVDSWFPIDYSNRAPLVLPGLVDWSTAPADWSVYHPSPEDFRRPGAGRRTMARTLDLVTGEHTFGEDDLVPAFERARSGWPAIVSVFDHDYRDIAERVDSFRGLVTEVAARYPDVHWRYAAPSEAVRQYVGAPRGEEPFVEAAPTRDGGLAIWTSAPIHQSIPWLATRDAAGSVAHVEEGLVRVDATHWRWWPSASAADWHEAAVGVSTPLGASATARVAAGDGPADSFLRRPLRPHAARPRSIWEHSTIFPASVVARGSGVAPEMDSVRQAVEWLAPRLEPGSTVLDVGSAGGHLARSLPEGVEYHGIDSYARAIEIARVVLEDAGVPRERLRALAVEDLPPDERYDAVVSLSTLLYSPRFELPLEAMARAARHWLVVRSSFGDETEVRYLPDVLLEPPFQSLRAYFNVYGRAEVEAFLVAEGFRVEWREDQRQREHFGGDPEVVGGIELPYSFLFAERVAPPPEPEQVLGEHFGAAAPAARNARGDST